jgi:hypothetical protein
LDQYGLVGVGGDEAGWDVVVSEEWGGGVGEEWVEGGVCGLNEREIWRVEWWMWWVM